MKTNQVLRLLDIPNLSRAIERSGYAMGIADDRQMSVEDLASFIEFDLELTNLLVDALVEGKTMERIDKDGSIWIRSTQITTTYF